jgi:signal transduction histidine kinase
MISYTLYGIEDTIPNCRPMTESPPKSADSRAPDAGAERLIAIGRLAGSTAHKINNHLTTILMFSHLVRDKANLDAKDREDLDLIIHEAKQAAAQARNLLDFGGQSSP